MLRKLRSRPRRHRGTSGGARDVSRSQRL